MTEIGPLHYFANQAEWRSWLLENHASQAEAWLALSRKHAAGPALTLPEAIDEALCFGWVDSILKPIDQEKFALRFSPRKDDSIWSEGNKKKVLRLIEQGRMTDAGLAKVRAAQESGEWERATSREVLEELPPELETALAADPRARLSFDKLSPSRRKQLIWWIASARRDETRQKRVAETIRLAREQGGPA
jgi:uncharacterized protein YdeI (YjbR/CyaY-like superfamily)